MFTFQLSEVRKAVVALVTNTLTAAATGVAVGLGVDPVVVLPLAGLLIGVATKLVHRIPNEVSVG